MELFTTFGNPAADQGRWIPFKQVGDERVRFRVRVIPSPVEDRLSREIQGNKRRLTFSGRRQSTLEVDMDQGKQLMVAKAIYALLDSENAEFRVGDDQAADEYSESIGRRVEPNELVRVDGLLGQGGQSAEQVLKMLETGISLKCLLFRDYYDLAVWVVEAAEGLRVQADEREGGLRGN